jgi:hypothetical protein
MPQAPQGDTRHPSIHYPRRATTEGACSCPAWPACSGPNGTDWLTCRDDCTGCHPRAPRRVRDLDLGVVPDE